VIIDNPKLLVYMLQFQKSILVWNLALRVILFTDAR